MDKIFMNSSQSSIGIEQYWQVIKRHWIPGTAAFLSVLTLGIVATMMKEDIYEAKAKLRFKGNTVSSSLTDINKALGEFSPLGDKGNPVDTEAQVLQSLPLVKKTINHPELQLKNEDGEELSVDQFLKNLQVDLISTTDILEVSYRSNNPENAAKIVNVLIKNYLENSNEINTKEAAFARQFLEKQLPRVEQSLLKTESSIRQLKEENQLINPAEESNSLIDIVEQLDEEKARIKSQMANANSRAKYLRNKLGLNSEQAVALSTISQSPEIQDTINQLQKVQSELALDKVRFTSNSPKVQELEDQANALKDLLQNQTQSIGSVATQKLFQNTKAGLIQQQLTSELVKLEASNLGLSKQLNSLNETEGNQRQRMTKLPQVEQKLRRLERQLAAYQSSYQVLWEQLEKVRIAENQNSGSVRVIENAVVPDKPASARAVGYLASGSLALLAASGVIYLLEISDKSIKTVEEAKQIFGYTWLGVIPNLDQIKLANLSESSPDPIIPKLVVRDYPSLPISESYRMLQSNLKFLSSDKKVKTIVVTSSVTQEGKSSVAANLAAAMAQVGNKVLLIDGDLHHPTQDRIWDIYNDSGLSNVIAEQLDPRVTIETVMPNLDLLTSGVMPPSPATLLDSQRMRMLLDYWSERYDFVIIDTPPLDLVADAPILGRMADGVLLVVKPGLVEKEQAIFTKEILEQSGQNMLGIVFNGVSLKVNPRNHYYYSLEDKQNVVEQEKLLGSPKEELWESISRLTRKSKKNKLDSNLDAEQLQVAPLDKLEAMVVYLQEDLADLIRLVKEQENELLIQRQVVKKLQRKANIASENEPSNLQNQLEQEQERKRMLDETLIGQRRNLEKRKEMLYLYQQALENRQDSSRT